MSIDDIVRTWKDPDYADARDGTATPASPAGVTGSALDDAELARVVGGEIIPPKTMIGAWVCLTAGLASAALSCLRCETTVFDGTCGAASFGCCPDAT